LHKGHGGACGNTVWHGAIFPKREDSSAFFDEDKLGYLRCRLDVHPEFKEYSVEWEKPWMKDVLQWMTSATTRERTMGTRYSDLVFATWRDNVVDGNDQIDQIELVRWLLGPNETNTKVDSEFIEQDYGMVGAAGIDGTVGPGDATNGDEDGNSIVDKTTLTAVSETGSRLKRASKEVAIEKTTKNARQKLMQGPSQEKSQPKPKINVKLETGEGTLMQLREGYKCYEDEEPG
jgi:hypothetical protein